jgi:hypothetical protein
VLFIYIYIYIYLKALNYFSYKIYQLKIGSLLLIKIFTSCMLIFKITFLLSTSLRKMHGQQNIKFFNSFDRCSKNTQLPNFVKIHPVGAELFHADRGTDGRTQRSFAILRTCQQVIHRSKRTASVRDERGKTKGINTDRARSIAGQLCSTD